MKRLFCIVLFALGALGLSAQEYPELGAKLDEYFVALAGDSASVQNAECDFLISSCQDSLVRQYVALKIYDHYLNSKIMGDDAVAVHVARTWFLSGKIPMHSDTDLLNAQVFVTFNESSLVGMPAPSLVLKDPSGAPVKVPSADGCSALYFYDTSCSTCKVESARLNRFLKEGTHPVTLYAVYTGSDADAWTRYRASSLDADGVVHLWDPDMDSDYQRLYGVLKTPQLVLADPSGTILGRGLDTPALSILLNNYYGSSAYTYGSEGQMALYDQAFAVYGDTLTAKHVVEVADYLAARTFGEGDIDSFKQMEGDLLYYLSSQRGEAYKEGTVPFVEKFILQPDIWDSPADKAQVVSLGELLKDLISRTPVGTQVPDLKVHGVLRRKPCLFRRDGREGVWALRRLKGRPGYVVFYTNGCGRCEETLSAVDAIVASNRKARILLVDMDALFSAFPEEAQTLLDTFDLSALPFVLELDKSGMIVHKYVEL